MSRILLMACNGGSLKNGGSPSTISITIIPEKQEIRNIIEKFRLEFIKLLIKNVVDGAKIKIVS